MFYEVVSYAHEVKTFEGAHRDWEFVCREQVRHQVVDERSSNGD